MYFLQSFTRHHVKGCDYPAIVPYNVGSVLLKRELEREDRCVRGVIVSGLTPQDVAQLDVFEGDVRVSPKSTATSDLNCILGIQPSLN